MPPSSYFNPGYRPETPANVPTPVGRGWFDNPIEASIHFDGTTITDAFKRLMERTTTVPTSAVHPYVLAELLARSTPAEQPSDNRPRFETFPDPGFHKFGDTP